MQVTAQVNTPHILTCGDITSTPPVHYTWTGPTVSLFPTLGIIQGIEGKLYFQLVTAAVEDTYVCRVSNDHLQVSQVGYIQLTAVAAGELHYHHLCIVRCTATVIQSGCGASVMRTSKGVLSLKLEKCVFLLSISY